MRAGDEAARKKAEKERADKEAEVVARMGLTKVPVVEKPVRHDDAASTGVEILLQHASTGLSTSVLGQPGIFYQG